MLMVVITTRFEAPFTRRYDRALKFVVDHVTLTTPSVQVLVIHILVLAMNLTQAQYLEGRFKVHYSEG